MTAIDHDRPENVDDDAVYVEFAEDGTVNDPNDTSSWEDPDHVEFCEDFGGTALRDALWCCDITGSWHSQDAERGQVIVGRYRDTQGEVEVNAARARSGYIELDENEYGVYVFADVSTSSVVECHDTQTYYLGCDTYESRYHTIYFASEEERDEYDYEHSESSGICAYHESPDPVAMFGAETSRYRVGFEVEKSALSAEASDLWAGFEEDSSCGYEAITNILPLSTDASVNAPVLAAMQGAQNVLDAAISSDCGGHVTISDTQKSSAELAVDFRTRAGFMYAPWGYRLRNQYCGGESLEKHRLVSVLNQESTDKYSPLNVKSFGVEWRLPNAVCSVACLVNRYRYFAAVVETFGMSWVEAVAYVRPFMVALYLGDEAKAEQRLKDAGEWQAYVDRDAVTPLVARVTRQTQRAGNAHPCRPEYVPPTWGRGMMECAWRMYETVEGRIACGDRVTDAVAAEMASYESMFPANPDAPLLFPPGWSAYALGNAYRANEMVASCGNRYTNDIYERCVATIPDNPNLPELIPEGWTRANLDDAYYVNTQAVGSHSFSLALLNFEAPLVPNGIFYSLPEGWTLEHMHTAFRANIERRAYGALDFDFQELRSLCPDRLDLQPLPEGWTSITLKRAYMWNAAHGTYPDAELRESYGRGIPDVRSEVRETCAA